MPPARPRFSPEPSNQLQQFRGVRHPLPPGDKRVLAVLIVHLCFLPWALGGMRSWGQLISLGLAIIGFAVAFWSVARYRSDAMARDPSAPRPPTPFRRLMKFPPFWLGLALLAYIVLQSFNPTWQYVTNGTHWWLKRVPNISWLPTSIETPFERFNLWRQFIIYASAWLTLCTVAIGLTRRRSFMLLLTVLAANGLALAAVGLFMRATTSTEHVLWLKDRIINASTFGSFVYKNHAGAYLALMAVVMMVLAARHRERALREHSQSSPAPLGVFGALLLFAAVVFSYSRGSTLLLGGYLILAALVFLIHRYFTQSESTTPRIVTFTVMAMIAFVVAFALAQMDFGRVMDQFEKLAEQKHQDASISGRLDARAAGQDMLSATWPRGLGAGSFRFLFPQYIKRFSASYRGGSLFWEHAHNDWLEIPIELGLIGTGLIVAGIGWGCWRLGRTSVWRRLPPLLLALGLLQTLVHAAIDFPLQNPAILITWLVLALIATRFNDRQFEG